jgi:hypothetical protein
MSALSEAQHGAATMLRFLIVTAHPTNEVIELLLRD